MGNIRSMSGKERCWGGHDTHVAFAHVYSIKYVFVLFCFIFFVFSVFLFLWFIFIFFVLVFVFFFLNILFIFYFHLFFYFGSCRLVIYAIVRRRCAYDIHVEHWVDNLQYYENRFNWNCDKGLNVRDENNVGVGIIRNGHYDAIIDLH